MRRRCSHIQPRHYHVDGAQLQPPDVLYGVDKMAALPICAQNQVATQAGAGSAGSELSQTTEGVNEQTLEVFRAR
jgi:hypothetical protein